MSLQQVIVMVAALLLAGNQALAVGEFRKLDLVPPTTLTLPDLSEKPHSLDDYKDKVVLVNFWASWCPPCREEMPSLQRLGVKMAGQPFVILGVDSAESRQEVLEFLKKSKVDFPVLLDPDGKATRQWKVYALPTSFVIDREGRIRYSLSGPTEWDEGEALQLIESLLQKE